MKIHPTAYLTDTLERELLSKAMEDQFRQKNLKRNLQISERLKKLKNPSPTLCLCHRRLNRCLAILLFS